MLWIATEHYKNYMKNIIVHNIRNNRTNNLLERRTEVYKMMKETSNIEDYKIYERNIEISVLVYITNEINIMKNISG